VVARSSERLVFYNAFAECNEEGKRIRKKEKKVIFKSHKKENNYAIFGV